MSMWDAGRYEALADRLVPATESLVQWAGPGDGRAALDLAAGDGRGAAALLAAGWQVTAVDSSPRLAAVGRARTGPRVVWHEADFHHVPVPTGSQHLVTSSFGLIFSADPAAALVEVSRVLEPGGRLLYTAWTRTGVMGVMTARMSDHLSPPPPGAPDGFAWAEPDHPGDLGVTLEHRRSQVCSLPWVFPSAEQGADELFRVSPAHIAAEAMAGDRGPDLRAAVRGHLEELSDDRGRVNAQAEYVIVELVKQAPSP